MPSFMGEPGESWAKRAQSLQVRPQGRKRPLDQKCRYDAVDDRQDRREQPGMRREQKAQRGSENESTPGIEDLIYELKTEYTILIVRVRRGA